MQQQQQPEEDEEPPPLQQSPSSDASCSSPSSTASSSSSLASPSSGGGVKEVAASSSAAKILLPPSRTYSATTTTTKIMIDTSSSTSTSPPHSSTTSCTCPSSLHSLNECSRVYSQCPVCLIKFDAEKPPIALSCSHTICLQCATLLVGIETERQQQQLQSQLVVGRNNNGVVLVMGQQQDGIGGGGGGDQHQQRGIVNEALLTFLDGKHTPMPTTNMTNTDPFMRSCNNSTSTTSTASTTSSSATTPPVVASLCRIARLIRSHTVSRSIHRKTILLINSLTPADLDPNATNSKLLKPLKSLGERCLVELTSSCAHVSHYHAQQQLWAAIRARACQFMGPAMQDEALRLVLLALEDGSALSRKVLVMFVVQRLAPQFPQASKTSVGHIVQLLYRASAFDVLKRPGNSSLMTLRAEFRNYEALRREHDTQIMKIGLEAGIRFTPEQYSSLLYGDTSQKPLMQSIIDKLQSPQTFQELLKEYLVSVQRLSNPDQLLVNLHPHFKVLSLIDVGGGGSSQGSGSTDPTCSSTTSPPFDATSLVAAAAPPPPPTSTYSLPELLDSLHAVLLGLITFTANRKHQRNNGGGGGGAAGGNNGTGITGSALGGGGDGRLHHHGGPTLTRTASSGGVLQQVHHQPVTASTNSSAATGLHFTSSGGNNKHHAQHSHHHHHQLQHHGSVGYSTGIYPGIGGCGGGQQQQLLSRTVSGASATPSSLANNNNNHHHHHHHNSPTNNNNSDNNNTNNNNNNVVITTTMMANLCV